MKIFLALHGGFLIHNPRICLDLEVVTDPTQNWNQSGKTMVGGELGHRGQVGGELGHRGQLTRSNRTSLNSM